jgi:hypothetical protein
VVGPKTNGRLITLRGDPKDIIVLGNKKVDDTGVRGTYARTQNLNAATGGSAITTAQKTLPTLTINSASFSGANLNLILTPSNGANNNVVKVDVYIDGVYKKSFNTNLTSVSFNTASLASGSHTIEVRAFTKYMYSATATTSAVK